MFICFGFLSLVNAYDFFNQRHVPYMVDQLEKANKQEPLEEEKETTEC